MAAALLGAPRFAFTPRTAQQSIRCRPRNAFLFRSRRPVQRRGLLAVTAAKRREDRFPFDKPQQDEIFTTSEGLHVSLFTRIEDLPPDGRTISEDDESCDRMTRRCRTPTYVYESPCPLCKATGMVESKSKGHRTLYTCLSCHGLGYVRRVTTRFVPEVGCDGTGPNLTLRPELRNGRDPPS